MSSHHFVREGQEPALLITDEVTASMVEPLLEWSPLVLVAESAIRHVLAWGIKIDVMLVSNGRTDELKMDMQHQAPVKFLPCRQDDMLSTAMRFLESTRCGAVNICAGHAEGILEKLNGYEGPVQIAVMDQDFRWLLVRAVYKKWLPASALVRVISSGDIHTAGLERHGEQLIAPQEGRISIESNVPFWVGEAEN